MDPGYDKTQFHSSNINAAVGETFTSFQIILRQGEPDVNLENGVMTVGFIEIGISHLCHPPD